MIKKVGNLWFVFNESGTTKLSKGFKTEEEANERLKEIESLKSNTDSFLHSNIDYELTEDTILIHNVPIVAEMVQEYNDGYAYKPFDVIKNIEVEQVPLTLISDSPSHPDKHLEFMRSGEKAGTIVGFMTEPSKPKSGQDKQKKRYADLVIYRTPKTKSLEEDIVSGEKIDTSIGFQFEQLDISGNFNGQNYDYIQSNIKLDHNALLIDANGNKGIGRMPNPIGGIGADEIKKNNEVNKKMEKDPKKLQVRIDELEEEKKISEEKSKETEKELSETKEKLSESESKTEEAEKKSEEAEKKVESDSNLKEQNDSLRKEVDQYKAERKVRVDAIKDKLMKSSPEMKDILDAADDALVLKLEKSENDNNPKHISAKMSGNDQNAKKVDDTAVGNYFGLKKE